MPLMRQLGLFALLWLAVPRSAAAALLSEPAMSADDNELRRTEVPIVEVPENPRRLRWYGQASVGFVYRWSSFDPAMLGAALDGELGAQKLRLAGGVRMHLEAGRILAGLPFQVVTFGPMLWARVHERVRLGAGIDAGAFLLSRRTLPGRSMWTVMIGGHIGGSIDLWKLGTSGALHLDGRVGAYAFTQAPGPVSVSTTLAVGYRL